MIGSKVRRRGGPGLPLRVPLKAGPLEGAGGAVLALGARMIGVLGVAGAAGGAVLIGAGLLLAGSSRAQAPSALEPAVQQLLEAQVLPLLEAPEVITAIRNQNRRTLTLDASQIDELDQRWRSEIGAADQPTVQAMLDTPISELLHQRALASKGLILELLLMDAQGLNVGVSKPTSDYWQGDEAKHIETFGTGAGAMHIGPVEFDESSHSYMLQVSFTVIDPHSRAPIGALTAGLNAEMLL